MVLFLITILSIHLRFIRILVKRKKLDICEKVNIDFNSYIYHDDRRYIILYGFI